MKQPPLTDYFALSAYWVASWGAILGLASAILQTSFAASLVTNSVIANFVLKAGALVTQLIPFSNALTIPILLFVSLYSIATLGIVSEGWGKSDNGDLPLLTIIQPTINITLISWLIIKFVQGKRVSHVLGTLREYNIDAPMAGLGQLFLTRIFLLQDTASNAGVFAYYFFIAASFSLLSVFISSLIPSLPFISLLSAKVLEFVPFLASFNAVELGVMTWLSMLASINYQLRPSVRAFWLPLYDLRVNKNLGGEGLFWIQSRNDLNIVGQVLNFFVDPGKYVMTLLSVIEKACFPLIEYGSSGTIFSAHTPTSQWFYIPYLFKLGFASLSYVVFVPAQFISSRIDTVFDVGTLNVFNTSNRANWYSSLNPHKTYSFNKAQAKYINIEDTNYMYKAPMLMAYEQISSGCGSDTNCSVFYRF